MERNWLSFCPSEEKRAGHRCLGWPALRQVLPEGMLEEADISVAALDFNGPNLFDRRFSSGH